MALPSGFVYMLNKSVESLEPWCSLQRNGFGVNLCLLSTLTGTDQGERSRMSKRLSPQLPTSAAMAEDQWYWKLVGQEQGWTHYSLAPPTRSHLKTDQYCSYFCLFLNRMIKSWKECTKRRQANINQVLLVLSKQQY